MVLKQKLVYTILFLWVVREKNAISLPIGSPLVLNSMLYDEKYIILE